MLSQNLLFDRVAHYLHVEEVNFMHQQSYRDQSNQLVQLLSGPVVGSESERDRQGGPGEEEREDEDGKSSGAEQGDIDIDENVDSRIVPGNTFSFARITQVPTFLHTTSY